MRPDRTRGGTGRRPRRRNAAATVGRRPSARHRASAPGAGAIEPPRIVRSARRASSSAVSPNTRGTGGRRLPGFCMEANPWRVSARAPASPARTAGGFALMPTCAQGAVAGRPSRAGRPAGRAGRRAKLASVNCTWPVARPAGAPATGADDRSHCHRRPLRQAFVRAIGFLPRHPGVGSQLHRDRVGHRRNARSVRHGSGCRRRPGVRGS